MASSFRFKPTTSQLKLMILLAIAAWFAVTILFVNGIGISHLQGNIYMSGLDAAGVVLLFLLIIRFLAVGVNDIFRV